MLKSPRLFQQLLRQTPLLHDALLGTPLKHPFARQLPRLPSRGVAQKRAFAVANVPSSLGSRAWRASRFRTRRSYRRHNSSQAETAKPTTLSGRMKEMSRKYGWTVTGIYLGLSVLDFPFCFLAVKWFGTERIAEIEHTIMDAFWNLAEKVMPSLKERRLEKEAGAAEEAAAAAAVGAAEEAAAAARDAGDQVAKAAKHKNPGLGTQLLLAYGVHKSLIFFRIPITLAITPKVVKQLRKWGWQIGKAKPKTV